jgi:hypothetical protein
MPTDKEPFYDFADTTKADSEKWKAFRRDTMHQTMKSYGPIGALTDPDPLDADDEPGSELWGLKKYASIRRAVHLGLPENLQ